MLVLNQKPLFVYISWQRQWSKWLGSKIKRTNISVAKISVGCRVSMKNYYRSPSSNASGKVQLTSKKYCGPLLWDIEDARIRLSFCSVSQGPNRQDIKGCFAFSVSLNRTFLLRKCSVKAMVKVNSEEKICIFIYCYRSNSYTSRKVLLMNNLINEKKHCFDHVLTEIYHQRGNWLNPKKSISRRLWSQVFSQGNWK